MSAVAIPHHISHEPAAADRGFAFGAARAEAVGVTVRLYRRLLARAAEVSVEQLRAVGEDLAHRLEPALVSELEGLAAGARQDVRELIGINARTELLAGRSAAECSVIGRVRDGTVSLAQTWDWHPDLAAAVVAWTVVKPDGTWFTTVTEAGILAKLGVNGQGVACALNFLTCSADRGTDGMPIHLALRLLLEHADSGPVAQEMLRSLRTSASSCVTVAAAPHLFAAELSPGGTTIIEPDDNGRLVHTNHFLAPPPTGVDTQVTQQPGTIARRGRLIELLDAGATPLQALASHEPAVQPVCRHRDPPGTAWADRYATLLALAIDPAVPSLRIAAGPPCTTPFDDIDLPVAARAIS